MVDQIDLEMKTAEGAPAHDETAAMSDLQAMHKRLDIALRECTAKRLDCARIALLIAQKYDALRARKIRGDHPLNLRLRDFVRMHREDGVGMRRTRHFLHGRLIGRLPRLPQTHDQIGGQRIVRDIVQSIVGAPYFPQQRIRTLQVLPTDRKWLLRHRIQPRIPILLRADKRIADHIKDAGTAAVFLCDPIEQCETVRTRLLLRRTLRLLIALDHDLVDAAHRNFIRVPAFDLDHEDAHILDQ